MALKRNTAVGLGAALLGICPAVLAQSSDGPLRIPVSLPQGFELAAWRTLAGEGGAERLLLVGKGGELYLLLPPNGETQGRELRALPALPTPARTLLDSGPLADPDGSRGLFAADPRGLRFLDPFQGTPEWISLEPRARLELRTDAPRFAPFLRDVNGDGLLDVTLPGAAHVDLWLAAARAEGVPVEYLRSGRVRVAVRSSVSTSTEYLSERLEASFTVPGLNTVDVNGDGRADLLVSDGTRRGFHLQAPDGTFPVEPTVEVDLSLFRDSEAGGDRIRLGGTLSLQGEAQWTQRDLDGDGRADHVIAHGRKVWVFHGGESGPQFREPSAILKTADDVTGLLVVHLDEDGRSDLLLLRVELPTIPTLVMGLFAEWDVKVRATGYRNLDGRSFELRPSFQRDLRLRLPPIFDLLRDPYAIVERFRGVGTRFRRALEGDFDGDGGADLVLWSAEERRVDLWRGQGAAGDRASEAEMERVLREQLFGAGSEVWDLERLLGWLSSMASERDRRLTEGRPPDQSWTLEPPPPRSAPPPGREAPAAVWVDGGVLREASGARALLVVQWHRPGEGAHLELWELR